MSGEFGFGQGFNRGYIQKERLSENQQLARELESAFEEWKTQNIETRRQFSTQWLKDKGYQELIECLERQPITLKDLSKSARGSELWEYIQRLDESELKQEMLQVQYPPRKRGEKDVFRRTPEYAAQELEDAFVKWQEQPVETRGEFNSNWIEKNGFKQLCLWSLKNISIQELVSKSSNNELRESFVKHELKKRTPEIAVQELEEAFSVWQQLPQGDRTKFNMNWLSENGYRNLQDWCINKKISLLQLSKESHNEILKKSIDQKYTQEEALLKLKEASIVWEQQPKKERKKFNTSWLCDNGYGDLQKWCEKNKVSLASAFLRKK